MWIFSTKHKENRPSSSENVHGHLYYLFNSHLIDLYVAYSISGDKLANVTREVKRVVLSTETVAEKASSHYLVRSMLHLYRTTNMAPTLPLVSLHHRNPTFESPTHQSLHALCTNEHHSGNTSNTNLHSTHASRLQHDHDQGIETSKLQSC